MGFDNSKLVQKLKENVNYLFSNYNEIHTIINKQASFEIEFQKESVYYERFFFVVNLVEFKISDVHGVHRWLGYSDSEFTIETFFRIIHPDALRIMYLTTSKIFEMLCTGSFPIKNNLDTKYITLIPLKRISGEYINVKKVSSILEYDNNNKLLSYLNEFTIIGMYNKDDIPILKPRITNDKGDNNGILEKKLMQIISSSLDHLKIFSMQELRILRAIAYNQQITRKDLCERFKISLSTVDTYYKRILLKSRSAFNHDFQTAAEIAYFLKKQALI